MHGEVENSLLPRTVWVLAHLVILGVAWWILFAGGYQAISALLGRNWHVGDPTRRGILFACSVVMWMRTILTAYYLLKRRFGWGEALAVIGAVTVYQLGLALAGAGTQDPLSGGDAVGICLFVLGSALTTGSEIQRKRFKDKPEHKGQLYTGGFFRLARHVNYLGDSVWLTGWALVTRNGWAVIMPIGATAGFIFVFIPALSKHLQSHYGEQYTHWSKRTARFVPFVY